MLKRKKLDLFGLWLDCDGDWSRVEIEAERLQQSTNLSRKQWTAMQAKEIRKTMSEERFNDLVKKRTEAGLYYKDEEGPSGSKYCLGLNPTFLTGTCFLIPP